MSNRPNSDQFRFLLLLLLLAAGALFVGVLYAVSWCGSYYLENSRFLLGVSLEATFPMPNLANFWKTKRLAIG